MTGAYSGQEIWYIPFKTREIGACDLTVTTNNVLTPRLAESAFADYQINFAISWFFIKQADGSEKVFKVSLL